MRLIHKLSYLPFYVISALPFPILYIISNLFRILIFDIFHYRQTVIHQNLQKSFPAESGEYIEKLIRQFQWHFADIVVETLKLLTISEAQMKTRINVQNPQVPKAYLEKGRGVIFYTSHLGNWEWLTLIARDVGYPVITFYQPLSSRYFDRLLQIIRSRFEVKVIPNSRGYRAMLQNDIQTGYCMIGDQHPGRNKSRGLSITFLGQDTRFLTGPAEIGKRMDMVLIFPVMRKKSRGNYEVEYQLITDQSKKCSTEEIVGRYAAILEQEIVKDPTTWLWSHKRWKA